MQLNWKGKPYRYIHNPVIKVINPDVAELMRPLGEKRLGQAILTGEFISGVPDDSPVPVPSPSVTPTISLTPSSTPIPTPTPTPSATPPSSNFIMKVKTDNAGTSNSDQFTLPSYATNGNNFTIYWGDTTTSGMTGTGAPVDITHTYPSAGTYTIEITSDFDYIYFNAGGDGPKVLEVMNWGDAQWADMNAAFAGCSNMTFTNVDVPDMSQIISLSYVFQDTNFSGNSTFNSWNTSGVTEADYAFYNSQFNSPIGNWDMSNVYTMNYIFGQNMEFNQNIDNWIVSGITNFNSIFYGAEGFNQPLNSWDVSNATDFIQMFFGAIDFNQPLSGWNMSNATNLSYTFKYALAFNQNINNWDVSSLQYPIGTFEYATSFNQPLSGWNTSAVISYADMFQNASSFNQDISNFSLSGVSNNENFGGFLNGTAMSTENYSKLLISWGNQVANNGYPENITMNNGSLTYNDTNYGGSPYSDAVAARAVLVSSGWTITDGGQV